jgi:hypothetical protein
VIVTPLPGRATGAVRRALLSHGLEGTSAGVSAAALEPWSYHITGAPVEVVEGLLRVAPKFGLELITGDGWVLLAGTRSRLSAMARSWSLPVELAELAVRIGEGLPADLPEYWRLRSGPVSLTGGPVLITAVPVPGSGQLAANDFQECAGGIEAVAEAAGEAHRHGDGLLVSFTDPHAALEQLAPCLDAAGMAGLDPEQIAVDPGWGHGDPGPDLARFRAFGRPTLCTLDDPVLAAIAWDRGVRLFRTAQPEAILRALATADAFGA